MAFQHADGQLWISNSVFQGAGTNCRAIDVNTVDGGSPLLYVKDTVFSTFTRNLAPGMRVTTGATAILDSVVFRDIELLKKTEGTVIRVSAIAAYPNSTLALVGMKVEGNIVEGRKTNRRAVGVAPGEDGTRTFAQPRIVVWSWPEGRPELTGGTPDTAEFLEEFVAPVESAWQAARDEQQAVADRNLSDA